MRRGVAGLVGLLLAGPAAGQGRGLAWGAGVVAVASDPGFVGAGPVGRWPVARQVVVSGFGAVGRRADRWVLRGEATVQYRVRDWASPRPAWYLAGGVAGVTRTGGGGYLVAGVGYETRIAAKSAFWAELGVAGGARLMVGIQSRSGRRK